MSINLSDFCPKCTGKNLVEHLSPATSLHYGRLTCNDCGRFIKWLSKPKVPTISITRILLLSAGLEPWERKFLKATACQSPTKTEMIVIEAIQAKVNPATVGRGTG